MREAAGMSEFVVGFLLTTRIEELFVFWQTVKLRAQTVCRKQRDATSKLRLTKDKSENGYEEINFGDPEHLTLPGKIHFQELDQELGGVILAPGWIVSTLSIQGNAQALTASVEASGNR